MQCFHFKSLFFHFSIFFVLSAFVGTLCGILTKIHLLYVELISNAFDIKYQLMESILEVVILLSISWVSTLTGDNWMSLLTSLMVSVAIGFQFTIASTSTSNICNDLLSKFISSALTKELRIPLEVLICFFQTTPIWLAIWGFLVQVIQSAPCICMYSFILPWVNSLQDFCNYFIASRKLLQLFFLFIWITH